jgi:hypothetical protein
VSVTGSMCSPSFHTTTTLCFFSLFVPFNVVVCVWCVSGE